MTLDQKQINLIDKHLQMVLISNKVHNLTRITDYESAKILHIEDSLEALKEIKSLDNIKYYADMGSGGGFPGITLGIATGFNTTLIETVKKKADCLKSFISELDYKTSISVISDRIENHTINNRNKYDLITARALSSLSSLLELASPLIHTNGYFISYKGDDIDNELKEVSNIENKLGFKLLSNRKYVLSDKTTKHRILLYQKIKDSEIKLPRKLGFAQKKPLK